MAKSKSKSLEEPLHRSADETAPRVSVSIIDASQQFANGIDRDLVERLIKQGALDTLDLNLPWREFDKLLKKGVGESLIKGIREGADAANAAAREAARATLGVEPVLTFDATNPRVRRWIDRETANLVTNVTNETRMAIRAVVTDAMREELPPIEVHRRIKAVVGLNQRQAKALENYRRGLIGQGAKRADVTRLTEAYRTQALAYRADMIARTEMIGAVNQGALEGHRQARDAGLIRGKAMKEWLTAPEDGRLCPTCRAMNGATVPLDSEFNVTLYRETKRGLVVVGHVKIDAPAVHPHCRCTVLLVTE